MHPSEERLKANYVTKPHEGCFLQDAPLRSFAASHIPRFFAHPKKRKEREKMATSRDVDPHFRGRKCKTSGDATRKCSKNGWHKVSLKDSAGSFRGMQTLNWINDNMELNDAKSKVQPLLSPTDLKTTAECSHCSEVYRSRTYCPLPLLLLTCVFQMCTHLSKEPLARCRPSGLNATL